MDHIIFVLQKSTAFPAGLHSLLRNIYAVFFDLITIETEDSSEKFLNTIYLIPLTKDIRAGTMRGNLF